MPYNKIKSEQYSQIGGINSKASAYVTGDKECLDIQNLDFQVPGGWNKRMGFTAAYVSSASFSIGASQTINAIWQVTSGSTALNLVGFDGGLGGVFNFVPGSTLTPWVTSVTTSPVDTIWDHSEYKKGTYYSGGLTVADSYKNSVGDTRSYLFGMRTPPLSITAGAGTAGTTFSGTYLYSYAYLDNLGFIGQRTNTIAFSSAGIGTVNIAGFSNIGTAYGITAYVIFRNRVEGFPTNDLISIGIQPLSSATFVDQYPRTETNSYFSYPWPAFTGLTGPSNYSPTPPLLPEADGIGFNTWDVSEIYQNRLWINFTPYLLAYSELEEPEKILPENVLAFANKNFRIIGMKGYNQSLIIFCQKGVFRLTGDNPDNFSITEMSTQYGSISDKAIVVFRERLWFLDNGEIIEFNGSNFNNIGNRVDAYLKRMNITRAFRRACAMHLSERNEVWFSIPIDGSDINNITLVYDYLVDGWTTFRGDKFKATALAELFSNSATTNFAPVNKDYYFGSIGASLFKFGSSLTSDDGTGITVSFTTKYHNELGKSQTAQFRRFYLDIGGYTGATLNFGAQFFSNYSTLAMSYTAAINIAQWQERIDFGIPAKSLSVKVSHGSTTGPLTINGYTIEFRYQRNV